jgi:hypothetical protein
MTSLPLPPRGPPQNAREAQILYERVRMIALWLDSIPLYGSRLPIGLEAIIGLIPWFGDIAGFVLGMYQIYLSSFFDLPLSLLMRMFMHVLIDCIIGIIPFVGDVLDIFYKANLYNMHILETWLKEKYGNGITIYKDDSGTRTKAH